MEGSGATLYESYHASEARSGGVYYLTQTFTPQTSHTIKTFKLLLSNDDTTGTLVGSIRATDIEGAPTGPNLATSQTINETTLPYDWTEVTFDLGSGCQLQAGTTYAIQIQTSQIGISVRADSGNPYDDGQYGKSNDGTNWNMEGWADYDIWFEEWGGEPGLGDYSYDANGNMLTGDGREITWDAENRPVSITKDGVTTTFVRACPELDSGMGKAAG